MKPDEYLTIHCASNEWGNETMQKIAMEYFENHPDCNFIEVYEHGGWYLGYRRDGSIWCTANDMAILTQVHPRPRIHSGIVIRR